MLDAVETIDDDESVAALEAALPVLAERTDLIEFDNGVVLFRPSDSVFDKDVIVVDEADPDWTGLNRASFDQIIEALGFTVSDRFGSISVYRSDTSE